jgi:hypothetical protein
MNRFFARYALAVSALGCFFAPLASTHLALASPADDVWVFDTSPITSVTPVPGKTSFKWNDRIYARVFFKDTLLSTLNIHDERIYSHKTGISQKIAAKGLEAGVDVFVRDDAFQNHFIDLEIFGDPAISKTKYGSSTFRTIAFKDGAAAGGVTGPQKMDFSMLRKFEHGAKASIDVDFTGFSAEKMKQESDASRAAGDVAYGATIPIPTPGKLQSAALVGQFVALAKREETAIVKARVIVTYDEWEFSRHEASGRIIDRVAVGTLLTKWKDGACRIDDHAVLIQDLVGGGFQAPGKLVTEDEDFLIDCDLAFGGGKKPEKAEKARVAKVPKKKK